MTEALHLDLESDAAAIAAFVADQNARTLAAFTGAAFDADVARARAIMEDPARIGGIARRGKHLFTWRSTPENPRGLWLRLPLGTAPTADAAWECIFDLDAHCRDTGGDWHWRGAPTLHSDPTRVLICLSQGGSDQRGYWEFDTTAKAFVDGGFHIPPEKGDARFLGADTLIWNTAAGPGNATHAGWSRVSKRLRRGQPLVDAETVFEGDMQDVTAGGYIERDVDGSILQGFWRSTEIGQMTCTIRRSDGADMVLATPGDTNIYHNATHMAWIAATRGDDPAGALVLAEIDGPNRRVLFTPTPRSAVDPEQVSFLRHWLIWVEHDNLMPRLRCLDLRQWGAPVQDIALPVAAQTIGIGPFDAEPMDTDETLLAHFAGMTLPPSIWTFDLRSGPDRIDWQPLVQQPAAFDATGLTVELLTATSDDGTEVPYHLVRRAAAEQPPVMMYGYGGYGMSTLPWYDAMVGALWLERGGAYAMAHIRGGGEFGPDWHLPAKGAGRVKAFADFAAIAADIAKRGITPPARIGCHGGSNGGLLCGVMLTQHPDRFGAVWAEVGVHDMLRYHLFPAGRAWIDEYGDPDDPAAAAWLRAYSPIHNIRPVAHGAYPAALIDTGDHDDRVDPSHSRRFVAALQAAGHAPWFMEHIGGHGGGGGSDARARQIALGYAFLRQSLKAGS